MLTLLYRSAAAWTAIGLIGGLGYREMTRDKTLDGFTQLSVVHTHALALGTTVGLVLLALAALFPALQNDRLFRGGVHAWNTGLAVTVLMLTVKGAMQVSGSGSADSPAIAGISGLGHIILTVAFVLLFVGLGRAVKVVAQRPAETVVEPAA